MSVESRMQQLQSQLDERQKQREDARNGVSSGDEIKIMSLKFGDNKLFVLWPEGHDLNQEVWLHFGFVDPKGNNRVYHCSKGKHGTCPICDWAETLKNTDKRQYDSIKAKKFFIYNVLDEGWNNRVLCAKPSQQEAIDAEIVSTYKIDQINVCSLESGRQLFINRTKSQPWCIARSINNNPITFAADQQQGILSRVKDLKTYYTDYTPQQLQLVLSGGDPDGGQQSSPPPAATTTQVPVQNTTPQPTPSAPQAAPAPVAPQSAPQPVQNTAPVAPVQSQPVPQNQNTAPAPTNAPVQTPNTGNMSVDEIMAKLNEN